MNFTIAELAQLPVPAAAFDRDNEMIASTPEWQGALPGAVAYPVRSNRLVISTSNASPDCELVLNRLLDAMDRTSEVVAGEQSMRVRMLATSLRILAGRSVASTGTSHDVIDFAKAGISARTSLQVNVEGNPAFPVQAPEVVALILVQFAANAERHARASSVTLAHQQNQFTVSWPGQSGRKEMVTSRQRSARERWGMAFSRIAADTIGGALYPPYDREDGQVVAALELGLNRLALPICAVLGQKVSKATRAWDEETGLFPGKEITTTPHLLSAVSNAAAKPGEIVITEGWWARAEPKVVWVAIPPDDIMDRARDVLDGIVHERALWDGVPEPGQSRVFALASLLGAMLGTPLPRVPAEAWNRKYPELAQTFDVPIQAPYFEGLSAVDPRIVAYLAYEFGEAFVADGDDLFLKVRPERVGDPFVRLFINADDNSVKLT